MDNGYIDLGKKYNSGAELSVDKKPKESVSYPTLFVSHDMKDGSGLDELPDGEFEFTGKARIVSYKENMKDGTCQCEIEVMGIKPSTKRAKKAKTSEENLDSALDEVVKKKAGKSGKMME
jgi:hypothetical protein